MIGEIHDIVWGPWTPVLFLMVGTVYSVRIRFFQVRKIPCWWDATIGNLLRDRKNHRESFRSACTALAATIGTGNITGVAAAVIAGGPGAVFWMWVSAFLGMATAYGETVLGIRYREKGQDGGWMAGPMMYLEKRLGCPRAAVLYGFFCIPAAFGMGSMVQANAISETVSYVYGIPEAAVGVILVALVGTVLAGGGQRIFRVAERLVPLSAGLYMAASLAVIFLHAGRVPGVLMEIMVDAFSFRSAAGGVAGYGISQCVSYGIARGVFSNEAGLGSLAVLNGSAESAAEELQGQWAIFEVFFDTIVSCTLTALVILCVAHEPLLFYGSRKPGRIRGGGLRGIVRVLHGHRLVLYGAAGRGVPWREDIGKDPGSLCGGISSGGVPRVPRGDGDGVGGLGHL